MSSLEGEWRFLPNSCWQYPSRCTFFQSRLYRAGLHVL